MLAELRPVGARLEVRVERVLGDIEGLIGPHRRVRPRHRHDIRAAVILNAVIAWTRQLSDTP